MVRPVLGLFTALSTGALSIFYAGFGPISTGPVRPLWIDVVAVP